MKRTLKGADGFTLIELMVVVAIIGILSSIAVPNFKKYQAKAKQSEAKIQLAAVYSTEVGANADYDTYGTCILNLGYEQPPKGYYIVGFEASDATSLAAINARIGTATCTATATSFSVAPSTHMKVDAGTLPAAAQLTSTSVSPTAFTAAAAGDISGSGAVYDIWRITDAKSLTNPTIGY